MVDVNEKKLEFTKNGGDSLLPFQLEKSVIRGRVVRLSKALDGIFERHNYPDSVASILAEAVTMAAALGSALKFDGVFTIQTQTDGPVSRLVVDVTSDGAIRACATYDKASLGNLEGSALLGQGHLIFTVDQKIEKERYQGVVALEGEDLSEAFQLYFKKSEQIPTGLMSAVKKDENGHWQAACLMVQRMPRYGGEEVEAPQEDTAMEDDWLRVMSLMQTCTDHELLDPALPLDDLLFRLFHEETVRIYDLIAFRDECRCSRDKIGGFLQSMSVQDKKDMVDDAGQVVVTCQFCSSVYNFDPDSIGREES